MFKRQPKWKQVATIHDRDGRPIARKQFLTPADAKAYAQSREAAQAGRVEIRERRIR